MPPLFFGALFGWLASMFVTVGSAIAAAIAAIVPIIRTVFNSLVGVFNKLAPAVGRFARAVFEFGKDIWSRVVEPVIKTLVDWYDRFSTWLRKVMAPIVKILGKVAEALEWVMTKIIAPILTWLERAKMFFEGLALLGIDWAKSIADAIQKVINAIQTVTDTIVTKFNEVVYFIDSILDPGGWIKYTPWEKSLMQWYGATMGMLGSFGIDREWIQMMRERQRKEMIPIQPSRWIVMFDEGQTRNLTGVQLAVRRFEQGQRLKV